MAVDGTRRTSMTAELGDQIAEMYLERDAKGRKLYSTADITRELHVPQSTIYWELRKRGIVPDRMNRRTAGAPTVEELLRENNELQAQLDALTLELEREKAINDALMQGKKPPARAPRKKA